MTCKECIRHDECENYNMYEPMTNHDYITSMDVDERAKVLTMLFHSIIGYTNAEYHIKQWLLSEVKVDDD